MSSMDNDSRLRLLWLLTPEDSSRPFARPGRRPTRKLGALKALLWTAVGVGCSLALAWSC